MNYFTPILGPPLAGEEGERWKERVTVFLDQLRERMDLEMEAFLSHNAQIGDIWTEQTKTATAAVGSSESMLFSLASGIPYTYRTPFVMPVVGSSGWSAVVRNAGNTSVTVIAFNHDGTSTNTTVMVRYF